jgi:hypothetical protein
MESPVELLSTEEFAARRKVSRSTVFEWIKTGQLEAGIGCRGVSPQKPDVRPGVTLVLGLPH